MPPQAVQVPFFDLVDLYAGWQFIRRNSRNGGMAEWRNGGMAEWRNGGRNGGMAERMAEWSNDANVYLATILWYTPTMTPTTTPTTTTTTLNSLIYIQANRAYGTEISPRSFVISFVILLYAISYNICI